MIFIPLCQCSLKSSLFSKRRLSQDPTNAKGRLKPPNGVFRRPPWPSIKSPVKAVTSMSSLPSPISAGRLLLLRLSYPLFPSRSSPIWAAPKPLPKTSASTASPPSSSMPVKPTAPPATNPPFRAARGCCRVPPPNLPGR